MKPSATFLTACFVGLALLCVGQASEGPNIILFVVDDMGCADWKARSDFYETPNMTRLANMGVEFTGAYASTRAASADPPPWKIRRIWSCTPTSSRTTPTNSGVDSHHQNGYNVLYVDGHVWFNKDDARVSVDLKGGGAYHTSCARFEQAWDWIADQEFNP